MIKSDQCFGCKISLDDYQGSYYAVAKYKAFSEEQDHDELHNMIHFCEKCFKNNAPHELINTLEKELER